MDNENEVTREASNLCIRAFENAENDKEINQSIFHTIFDFKYGMEYQYVSKCFHIRYNEKN